MNELGVSPLNCHGMRQILFVQGAGENVHDEWDDKLVASLRRELGDEFEVLYPVMPDEGDPKFAAWSAAVEEQIARLNDGAIVVGHSVGGTILINTLASYTPPITLGAIILLAAPFMGDGGWKSDDIVPRANLGDALPSGVPVILYHGTEDTTVPVAHLGLYAKAIPAAKTIRAENRDHQFDNDLGIVAREIRKSG